MRTVLAAWATSAAVLLAAAALAGKLAGRGYLGILIDNRGRYSLSHLQITLWTLVVLPPLAGVTIGRLAEGVQDVLDFAIPETLLAVLGISVGSATIATGIKAGKDATRPVEVAASDPNLDPPRVAQVVLLEEGQLADKIVDIGKFQSLWLTLVLVVAYVASAVASLRAAGSAANIQSLPAFTTTFTALLAISHAGYLGGKLPNRTGAPDGTLVLDLQDPEEATRLRDRHELKELTPRNSPAMNRAAHRWRRPDLQRQA
jgi:hypothetical protein